MMEAGVSVRIFYVKGLLTSGSWFELLWQL